ncbi:hypothetical protein F2Q69_00051136 [Brassica cretica]|uniref:Sulfotransferase n=1 Tax=Brassica cretica TaxID=69181 RepID=A0A8S9PUE1_BRACR|nr:hypothetical protein F2Q69_00051136 [Brassica cretica]
MPFHTLQAPFKDDSSRCKIVYVCRNVKHVLSSFESLCSGVGYFGPFWENVLSYGRGSLEDPQHVLFMRYEEMKSDPSAQVKRLAEFLGCPFTEEEHGLSIMEINKTGKTSNNLNHSSFFRKGEVGDSKNHLTPEMETKIDMIIEEKYKGSGFKY